MLAILSCVHHLSATRRDGIRYLKILNLEDHFAELRAGFEIGVRGGGFRQRKDAIDDGLELACGDKFHHRQQLRFCAHVGAEERKLPAEEEPEVDLGVKSSGGPTGHESSRWSKAREALVPGSCADVLEDDVNAALACDAAHFLTDFLCFVVDELVGAKLFGLLQFGVATGSCNHARAKEFGNLNCGAPHAASGPEN